MSSDPPTKEYWGNREWHKDGVLHRDGDLPAYISAQGDKEYYQNGKRHRDIGRSGRCKKGWYVFVVPARFAFGNVLNKF